jgi:hypothetical protein
MAGQIRDVRRIRGKKGKAEEIGVDRFLPPGTYVLANRGPIRSSLPLSTSRCLSYLRTGGGKPVSWYKCYLVLDLGRTMTADANANAAGVPIGRVQFLEGGYSIVTLEDGKAWSGFVGLDDTVKGHAKSDYGLVYYGEDRRGAGCR